MGRDSGVGVEDLARKIPSVLGIAVSWEEDLCIGGVSWQAGRQAGSTVANRESQPMRCEKGVVGDVTLSINQEDHRRCEPFAENSVA
ncbi:hypothetical protein M0804_012071 [Polistes exclamans]|nr:hypothetical protein M0804_012071 [Polistes exclamans]